MVISSLQLDHRASNTSNHNVQVSSIDCDHVDCGRGRRGFEEVREGSASRLPDGPGPETRTSPRPR